MVLLAKLYIINYLCIFNTRTNILYANIRRTTTTQIHAERERESKKQICFIFFSLFHSPLCSSSSSSVKVRSDSHAPYIQLYDDERPN